MHNRLGNYIVFLFLILRMMGTFFKGDKGKDYLKISNDYLEFARFRMDTEEDENINKPRQIDNLTQQATCDNEVRPFKAVFRLERATEVLELTYLGKYFACVNANWYPGKHRSRQ